jgi:hypothetical protein
MADSQSVPAKTAASGNVLTSVKPSAQMHSLLFLDALKMLPLLTLIMCCLHCRCSAANSTCLQHVLQRQQQMQALPPVPQQQQRQGKVQAQKEWHPRPPVAPPQRHSSRCPPLWQWTYNPWRPLMGSSSCRVTSRVRQQPCRWVGRRGQGSEHSRDRDASTRRQLEL